MLTNPTYIQLTNPQPFFLLFIFPRNVDESAFHKKNKMEMQKWEKDVTNKAGRQTKLLPRKEAIRVSRETT